MGIYAVICVVFVGAIDKFYWLSLKRLPSVSYNLNGSAITSKKSPTENQPFSKPVLDATTAFTV